MDLRRARIRLIGFTGRHHRLARNLWLLLFAVSGAFALAVPVGQVAAACCIAPSTLRALAARGKILVGATLALWLLLLFLLPTFSPWYSRWFRYAALLAAQAVGRARTWVGRVVVALLAWTIYEIRAQMLHPGTIPWRQIPWLSLIGGSAFALLLLAALADAYRTRRSILFLPFQDHTGDPTLEAEVAGLAARLRVELAAIINVYRVIDEAWNNPVGKVEDLLPRVGELAGDQLLSVTTGEAKLNLGPVQIPLGWLLDLPGRMVGRPCLTASVQREGTRFLLAAQLSSRSWSVSTADLDKTERTAAEGPPLAALVEQLAYRMVTDLASVGSPRWRAVRYYTRGLIAYRETQRIQLNRILNLRRAEELFLRARNEDNQFAQCYYNLAVVYTQLGQGEAAIAALLRALREGQATADVAQALGLAYYRNEMYEEAIQALNNSLLKEPSRAEAWRLKAFSLRCLRQRVLGCVPPLDDEIWGPVIEQREIASALAWRALCISRLRCETDLRPRKEAAMCLIDLAVGLAQIHVYRRSVKLMRQALHVQPDGNRYCLEMSKVLRAIARWKEALETLDEVLVDEHDIKAMTALQIGTLHCNEALYHATRKSTYGSAAHLAFCRLLDCLARISQCAVQRRRFPVGAKPTRQLVAPAGSNRSGGGGDEAIGASGVEGRLGRLGQRAGRNASERRAGLEKGNVGADPPEIRGRPESLAEDERPRPGVPPG